MAKDFKQVQKDLEAILFGMVSRTFMNTLGKMFREIVYRRVKSGYGVDPSSLQKQRLAPLSEGYIKYRKGSFESTRKTKRGTSITNKGAPKLGPMGTPSKSNLTQTGEMLESMAFRVEKYGVVLFFPNDPHGQKKRVTIRELANYVQENGRSFFYLSEDERRILKRELQNEVRRLSRRR